MAGRVKHTQRSHKTYKNNYGAYVGFQKPAMSVKQMREANENRSTMFARLTAMFSRVRYRRSDSK